MHCFHSEPLQEPPLEILNSNAQVEEELVYEDYVSLPYLDEHDPYYDINTPTHTLN